jgi:hypothetical protein
LKGRGFVTTDRRIINAQKTQIVLDGLLKGVDQTTASTLKDPADGDAGWTILEVMGHLLDFEILCVDRISGIVAEDAYAIQPINVETWPIEHDYQGKQLADVIAQRGEWRAKNIALLEALTPEQFDRTGIHPTRGAISIDTIALQLTTHDVDHLDQIVRILGLDQ